MVITRKQFRKLLNEKIGFDNSGKGINNRYKPNKRLYGDYLWHQDREMFEVTYQEYIAGNLTI
jgi:hypothetical protein